MLARSTILSRITSADPQILTYAVRVFGTTDLTEDQWKQCMDQVKVTMSAPFRPPESSGTSNRRNLVTKVPILLTYSKFMENPK